MREGGDARAWKETDSPNSDPIAVPTWLCGSGRGFSACVVFSLPVKQSLGTSNSKIWLHKYFSMDIENIK